MGFQCCCSSPHSSCLSDHESKGHRKTLRAEVLSYSCIGVAITWATVVRDEDNLHGSISADVIMAVSIVRKEVLDVRG